jgi:hypothetical protein
MGKPQIIIENTAGINNSNLEQARDRLIQGNTYKDLSTIIVVPTRGMIPARVVQSWLGLMLPMNNKCIRIFMTGMAVDEAYNNAIETILNHPDLSTWKYILTLEEDNMPPPDGLLRLYEGMDKYDVVSGLYWTKGGMMNGDKYEPAGQPMIYGNPKEIPLNFIPQVPIPNTLQEANGLGMGFNLFKISMFKDERIPRPWFKTVQEYQPGIGAKAFTQDLWFYQNAGRVGYRFACNTNVLVGHLDYTNDLVW